MQFYLENIIKQIYKNRNEIDNKFEIEYVKLKDCPTKNILDFISSNTKDKTYDEIKDYMSNYKICFDVEYIPLHENSLTRKTSHAVHILYNTFIRLMLNNIYEEVNNLYYTFIPRKIEDRYLFMNEKELSTDIFIRHVLEDGVFEKIINIYLQVLLCFGVIDKYYKLGQFFIYFGVHVRELEEEKMLTYDVMLNGSLVRINFKTQTLVKIYISRGLEEISYEENDVKYFTDIIDQNQSELNIYNFTSSVHNYFDLLEDILNYMYDDKILHSYDKILHYVLYKSGISEYLDFSDIDVPKYKTFGGLEKFMLEKLLFESKLSDIVKPKYFRE